jgi:hypothetical protein
VEITPLGDLKIEKYFPQKRGSRKKPPRGGVGDEMGMRFYPSPKHFIKMTFINVYLNIL